MRRVKSVVSERKSDRKKLYEKYSDRISTFRVCTNSKGLGSRYSSPPPSENANQNINGARSNQVDEAFNNLSFNEPTMPLQESNTVYRSNENQRLQEEQNLLYTLLAMTPVAAFESLPVNNLHSDNGMFSMQTVPNSYPGTTLSGFQDQTISNSVENNINSQMQMNVAANLAAFNQTVPRNKQNAHHHHHHHHGIDHYSSDPSLLIPAELMNSYGNHDVAHSNTAVNNLVNHQSFPSQSSTVGVTVPLTQTTAPPSPRNPSDLVGTPTRPSPPSLPGGPQYFQASEDFRMCFRRVDSDDNGFITLEELRIFLENKDGSRFNDDAVLTIMDMFDNS